MTIQSVRQSADTITLRYIPILVWFFVALIAYGLSTIVVAVANGREAADGGTLLAGLLLGGLALFAAISGGQVSVASFDRRAGTVRVRHYGLLGLRSSERPLADVIGLRVVVLRRAQHRVELQLRSGERLPLTPAYVVTPGSGATRRLAGFLGLEPTFASATGR